MSVDWASVEADRAATERASQAAQAAYNRSRSQLEGEQLALQRAQFAWQQEMDKAGLTGQYQGQWTMPVQQWQATTFGTWGAPSAGQQTLSAQQQAYMQAYQNALAYGQYLAPGTTPTPGQQTLQAQQQAQAQQNWLAQTYGGYYGAGQAPQAGQQTLAQQQQQWQQQLQAMQEARAAQGQQQQTALGYLNLLSQLRGPADWAKYQQVLGATPGGLRDLTAAAMGQYIPGGGATTGVQPQAVSLQSMQEQVGGGYPQQQGAASRPELSMYGGSSSGVLNYPQQQGAAMGGAGAAPGSQDNPMGQLPLPNQIAARSWNNLAPSQQQMLLGAYEAQGWNKDDVTKLYQQSLPRYASNAPSAGTWRLAS